MCILQSFKYSISTVKKLIYYYLIEYLNNIKYVYL